MRSLSNSLRSAQRGAQAHSQVPYIRLVFRPPDNLLSADPARIYTTRQASNRILSVQHLQSRYGKPLPVTETPNVAAIVILSNHDGSLSDITWEGWILRPYFGLVVGGTPEYQETESLLVSRAIFQGSEGTSTLELHLTSAWGRLNQLWLNRTTSSGPVSWLRGHPSLSRTIGQIIHQVCGGDVPQSMVIAGIDHSARLSTYATLSNRAPSTVDWNGSNLIITNIDQKFNTVNIGIRNGDATAITALFPNNTLTLSGDLSRRGVISIRLGDSTVLTNSLVLNHNGTSLEIEYITVSRDIGLYFTANTQLDYEPTYVSRGQADLLEVLREILSRTTYRPILRETGITLVNIGEEPSSVQGDTNRQYLAEHQIFSHSPSRRLIVPNQIVVSSLAQGDTPSLQKPYFEGIAPPELTPNTHPAVASQQSQGKITRFEVEASISSNAEAQTLADAYLNSIAFDSATARFSASMDVGLEVYDNVLVGHDVADDALDAGDPWTGLTSLGYVSDILRTWTPGFYRMSVTLGDIQTVYVPLTQSRQNYLIQQGLFTAENQENGLFETTEAQQFIEPFDTFWGRTQALNINTLIPTGDFPTSGLQGSRWFSMFADTINIGNMEIIQNPGTPQERTVEASAYQLGTTGDGLGGTVPIIRLSPYVSDGLVIDSGVRASTVRPGNLITDLGSAMMYWNTLYVNRIEAAGPNPQLVGFTASAADAEIQRLDLYDLVLDPPVRKATLRVDAVALRIETPPDVVNHPNGVSVIFNPSNPVVRPAVGNTTSLGESIAPWSTLYTSGVDLKPTTVEPSNPGQFALVGNDVHVYSGSAIVDLSNLVTVPWLAVPSTILPSITEIYSLGSAFSPWLHVDTISLVLVPPATIIGQNTFLATTDGTLWLQNSDIMAVSGGETRNLSRIPNQTVNRTSLPTFLSLTLTTGLVLGDTLANPTTPGSFLRNGADVWVYSGGQARNLSGIGGITFDPSQAVSIIPAVNTNTLGSNAIWWDEIHARLLLPHSSAVMGSYANPWSFAYITELSLPPGGSGNSLDGSLWTDANGHIKARSGGSERSLSDIGSGGGSSFDPNQAESIIPAINTNILGNSTTWWGTLHANILEPHAASRMGSFASPWALAFINRLILPSGNTSSTLNGSLWTDANGNVKARSGGSDRNLSDIGSGGITTLTGGRGIDVTGSGSERTILLDDNDLPHLVPFNLTRFLGSSAFPWYRTYTRNLYLIHNTETVLESNGSIWLDDSGNIHVYTGGAEVNLSNLGNDGVSDDAITSLMSGLGIRITGSGSSRTVILDSAGIPTILPLSISNDLGSAFSYWDALYVDHVHLRVGENDLSTNGTLWQDSSGDINAYSGGTKRSLSRIPNQNVNTSSLPTFLSLALTTGLVLANSAANPTTPGSFLRNGEDVLVYSGGQARNLSDIGSGDSNFNPAQAVSIIPAVNTNILGSSSVWWGELHAAVLEPHSTARMGTFANPWTTAFISTLTLPSGGASSPLNGSIWTDAGGNIKARSGGAEVNLSDIGSGSGDIILIGEAGISVSGYTISLDNVNMPTLRPSSSGNDLGAPTDAWDTIYVDHIRLSFNEPEEIVNGAIWRDSNNDIRARSGGVTRNFSDIGGSGTGITTLAEGVGINISGSGTLRTISLDTDDIPTITPRISSNDIGSANSAWDSLYVDHIRFTANEAASNVNGTMWRDNSGNIMAQTGGATKNLSDIGTGDSVDIVLTASHGILVSGYNIILDSDDMPPLYPAASINTLGLENNPWDALYVDHIYLTPNEGASTTNGVLWQDGSGNIQARTGGTTKNLSDIGTGGGGDAIILTAGVGISVSGYNISLNNLNMPTLQPATAGNDIGASSDPWDSLFVDHILLTLGQASAGANGTIWQDNDGNILARSGNLTRSLSNIGTGGGTPITLVGGTGISVLDYTISLNSNNLPTLSPGNTDNDLGATAYPWDALFVDHIYLHEGESSSTTNGAIWQDSSGNIMARSGGVTRSLSDIGLGGGDSNIILGGVGITVTGLINRRTISLNSNEMPTISPDPDGSGGDLGLSSSPWRRLYSDYIRLTSNQSADNTNGAMWLDSNGHIMARSGNITRSLSNIGIGSGDAITLIGGLGITVSGYDISVDGTNMPSLRPASSNNGLGRSGDPWDTLFVDHIFLTANQNFTTPNGAMWQDNSGNILARSGGNTKNLSDIIILSSFTGGTGITISGYNIAVDGVNMPTLSPSAGSNNLGRSSDPWDILYVDHVYLTQSQISISLNGVMWQDSSGNILVRTGGVTKSLSAIGSGGGNGGGITAITGGIGISVSESGNSRTIFIEGDNIPTLEPAGTGNDLGSVNAPWDSLYVDHIRLHEGESAVSTNGAIWQDSSGNIIVRSGGSDRNLSDIGIGGGNGITNLVADTGIRIAGSGSSRTIGVDGSNMPTLQPNSNALDLGSNSKPWDQLYVDHIWLTANEGATSSNGTIWQDGSGNIWAYSGGVRRNLSNIGADIDPATLIGGQGIIVSGTTISIDGLDMPTLRPSDNVNDIGTDSFPWDRVYTDHIIFTFNQVEHTANGIMWQDGLGNIMARSGNVSRNLSDIGPGSGGITLIAGDGISVSGYRIDLDFNNMPSLTPIRPENNLGSTAKPWSRFYTEYIRFSAGSLSQTTNGEMWQDSFGNIQARSGGVTRNLSDIGSGGGSGITTLIGDRGISITGSGSSRNVAVNGSNMPTLEPGDTSFGLGGSSNYWAYIFVDYLILHAGESTPSADGRIWQGSNGHIYARSGGVTRNLSDIGLGGGDTYIGGQGITISGNTISIDGNDLPSLFPGTSSNQLGGFSDYWDALWVDHLILHAGEPAISTNGAMWQGSNSNIYARSGGITRNLSDIGSGGGTTYSGGNGISISGNIIFIDGLDMPSLIPRLTNGELGSNSNAWDVLFVDHIILHAGEPDLNFNGAMWQGSNGHIYVRTGNVTKDLTDI